MLYIVSSILRSLKIQRPCFAILVVITLNILNPLLMEMLIPNICMNCLNEYFYVNMKKITVQFVKVKDVNAFINKEV